jgi:hypothetical protein
VSLSRSRALFPALALKARARRGERSSLGSHRDGMAALKELLDVADPVGHSEIRRIVHPVDDLDQFGLRFIENMPRDAQRGEFVFSNLRPFFVGRRRPLVGVVFPRVEIQGGSLLLGNDPFRFAMVSRRINVWMTRQALADI